MTSRTPSTIMQDFNRLVDEAIAAGITCGITPIYGGRATVAIMFNGDVKLEGSQLHWKNKNEQSRIIPQNE